MMNTGFRSLFLISVDLRMEASYQFCDSVKLNQFHHGPYTLSKLFIRYDR